MTSSSGETLALRSVLLDEADTDLLGAQSRPQRMLVGPRSLESFRGRGRDRRGFANIFDVAP